MRAVIIANGEFNYPWDKAAFNPDLIIAADGGSLHCEKLGISPDAIIGDFDSLDQSQIASFEATGIKMIRYPTHKDYTDLELALMYASDQGCEEILVLGALGNRWDQSLANLMLPAAAAFANSSIFFVDGAYEIQLFHEGRTYNLAGQPGDVISLIPIGGDANGIITQGLEYPLNRETLYTGATRGISNTLLGATASISLESGMLLCVMIHAQ